ncbi:MAG TPA: hypothetical protein VKQ71_17645 [Acidimicrobiales bacterium]|nr:hypothetical protein [Acidimicrobiales bacterium]
MGKTVLKYSALLIAGYLAVAYGTNWGTLIGQSSSGGVNVIKAFQGR